MSLLLIETMESRRLLSGDGTPTPAEVALAAEEAEYAAADPAATMGAKLAEFEEAVTIMNEFAVSEEEVTQEVVEAMFDLVSVAGEITELSVAHPLEPDEQQLFTDVVDELGAANDTIAASYSGGSTDDPPPGGGDDGDGDGDPLDNDDDNDLGYDDLGDLNLNNGLRYLGQGNFGLAFNRFGVALRMYWNHLLNPNADLGGGGDDDDGGGGDDNVA